MGLISVASSSMRGALQDIWRDYFYVDAIPEEVLVMKAHRRTNKRTKNHGDENILSNGSIISINDGQCAIITLNGKIQDICTETGEYVYNQSEEPSILCEGFVKDTFESFSRRFKFAGDSAQEYRVYYINTKEILGSTFGTASPIPFRVVDNRAGVDIDIRLKMAGSFTFKVTNPVTLYQNVTGNVLEEYRTEEISKQLRQEFLAAVTSGLSVLSSQGLRYSEIMLHANALEKEVVKVLKETWEDERGIQLCNIAFASVVPLDEDVAMIQQLQRGAAFVDPRLASANMMSAQMDAMRSAASNEAGAMTGFMGMNMAMGQMPMYQQPYYQNPMYQQPNMYQQPFRQEQIGGMGYDTSGTRGNRPSYEPPHDTAIRDMSAQTWVCKCGRENPISFGFCPTCGTDR